MSTPDSKEPGVFRRLGIDERKGKTCATDNHDGRAATYHFESGGIGSYYCTECQLRISGIAGERDRRWIEEHGWDEKG